VAAPSRGIDQDFLDLPFRLLADAALTAALQAGASYADFRFERLLSNELNLRDTSVETALDSVTAGFSVRVIVEGIWGFAADVLPSTDAAAATARQAVSVARALRGVVSERVERADEPIYRDVSWVSSYRIDPFSVPTSDKIALLLDRSEQLLAAPGVSHSTIGLTCVKENKFYADSFGTSVTQQRIRVEPTMSAVAVDAASGGFESMSSLAPPVGRGFEYLTDRTWDFAGELASMPTDLAEKMKAPSVQPGRYDLVIDPTNLWLTIHESIGHATEYDRAIGYEAAYAGTSFATPDQLGVLAYGSQIMNVTGDRTVEHGLATVGYDDDGVAGQQWELINSGIFRGYQLDRVFAHKLGMDRSNGCAFADSSSHQPLQRMANVSLRPDPAGGSTADLIAGVDNGIFVVGDKSWSIDMQRFNFQFTAQRFYAIKNGRLAGQLKDVAYQGTTTDFWGSMDAVGGPQTYLLAGSFNCGKGQPGQSAAVSHGSPSARFRGVSVLNTIAEGA